jgi:hypothetical protein
MTMGIRPAGALPAVMDLVVDDVQEASIDAFLILAEGHHSFLEAFRFDLWPEGVDLLCALIPEPEDLLLGPGFAGYRLVPHSCDHAPNHGRRHGDLSIARAPKGRIDPTEKLKN